MQAANRQWRSFNRSGRKSELVTITFFLISMMTSCIKLPEGSEAISLSTYLNQGRDTFSIDYDAHSGGTIGDGRLKLPVMPKKLTQENF